MRAPATLDSDMGGNVRAWPTTPLEICSLTIPHFRPIDSGELKSWEPTPLSTLTQKRLLSQTFSILDYFIPCFPDQSYPHRAYGLNSDRVLSVIADPRLATVLIPVLAGRARFELAVLVLETSGLPINRHPYIRVRNDATWSLTPACQLLPSW